MSVPKSRYHHSLLKQLRKKVPAAEDARNTRHPEKVSLACTIGTEWRNCSEFLEGRQFWNANGRKTGL
jgi:nuclear transport factor 2 (NTF2) superfamily protein